MALSLTCSANRLVWEMKRPIDISTSTSPMFYFQNCKCRFEFLKSIGNAFGPFSELHMVSMNGQMFPQPFTITSYVENGNNLQKLSTRQICFLTSAITIFDEEYSITNFDFRLRDMIKIVVIFHDEVGLTLRLASEIEKFTHVAVETNNETRASSSSCEHSTLEILSSDFSKLLVDDLYQDVELQCEDHIFKAHKNVLSTHSKVFSAMLQSGMLETVRIEVRDMKFDVCKMLLHYMYSGKLPELTLEIARGLYEVSDRYKVCGLMEACAKFLTSNLTTDNACEMLVLADAHSDQDFKESVIKYILDEEIPSKMRYDFDNLESSLDFEVLYAYFKRCH